MNCKQRDAQIEILTRSKCGKVCATGFGLDLFSLLVRDDFNDLLPGFSCSSKVGHPNYQMIIGFTPVLTRAVVN